MFKELDVKYDIDALLGIAETLQFTNGYEKLGRAIPQEISVFDLEHPVVKNITKQFPGVPFFACSFIKTKPNTEVAPHTDSSGVGHVRTVNFLFPLANYTSPITIEDKSFDINGPVAFRCDLMHSYINSTDDYRIAFILQCRQPWTFERLELTRKI